MSARRPPVKAVRERETQLQEREKRLKAELKPFEAADYHYRTLDHYKDAMEGSTALNRVIRKSERENTGSSNRGQRKPIAGFRRSVSEIARSTRVERRK